MTDRDDATGILIQIASWVWTWICELICVPNKVQWQLLWFIIVDEPPVDHLHCLWKYTLYIHQMPLANILNRLLE